MEKKIEQIKEEVARDFFDPSRTWKEIAKFTNDDNVSILEDSGAIDQVAIRYAQQFKTPTDALTTEIMVLRERVEELEGKLKSILYMSEDRSVEGCTWGDTDMSSTDVVYGYNLALSYAKEGIESLINKSK